MNRLILYFEGVDGLHGRLLLQRFWGIAAIIIIPSYLVSFLSVLLLPPQQTSDPFPSFGTIIFSTTLGPLVETYGMRLCLFVFRKFLSNPATLSLGVALVFGLLHIHLAWGLYAVWPFFVLTICYLKWEKTSVLQAMVGTTLLHALINAIGLLALLAQLMFGN